MRTTTLSSLALLLAAAPTARAQSPILISSDPTGVPANADCELGRSSFDGRWATFATSAPNLSPNTHQQVFVKDLTTWGVEYVSLSSAGAHGNGGSGQPHVSWDGRYVTFRSGASNLVPGDTNARDDVFMRDRWTGITTRESLGQGGVQLDEFNNNTDISHDGRFVLFYSSSTNVVAGAYTGHYQHYLRDRLTGQVLPTAISTTGALANAQSDFLGGGVSGDGHYVVFGSIASNLVPGDTNGAFDVFLRDMWAGTMTRISVNSLGQEGNDDSCEPYITDDGRYVVFNTLASNLVQPDTNNAFDAVVYELSTGQIQNASLSSSGQQANSGSYSPDISWDGRYVLFSSSATNLASELVADPDLFVHDRLTGTTELVTPTAPSTPPVLLYGKLSPGGRFAFSNTTEPWAMNHPMGTWQVYVTDRGPICITPYAYCTGKTNSLGCVPWMATFGCSSASADSGFYVHGGNVRNNKQGLLFYGVNGQAANPFQGGVMCVNAPKKRTPVKDSLGSPPPTNDCSGLWVIDMNEFATGMGGGHPIPELLVPGTLVDCQWWGRDPGAPFNTSLTNAVEYLVGL